jgi:2,4-dienoyl-CoA reductase-like NADH-dependent reductase (Old Yellow Enzyme family)
MAAKTAQGTDDLKLVWQPLDIGATRVRNRTMMTAMGVFYGEDNLLSDRHIAFYRERARGGVGLMITEQQAGHRLSKGSFYDGCTAWEKRVIPQYEKLADAVHAEGARQFAQLFGCGVHDKGTMIMDEWHPLWGISAIPSVVHREIPLVMGKAELRDIAKGFGEAAHNVKYSGLDGVEIHAAHSYLLGQVLSPTYNIRDDDYGGSVAKRCRLIVEVAEEIRAQVGSDFTVGIRLSYEEYMGEAGITPEQADEQLEILMATGCFDFFNITRGAYHTLHMAIPPMDSPHGGYLEYAKRARKIVGNRAKLFLVGRVTNLHEAEAVLQSGAADMVAMTRAQFADPHLVRKTKEGREQEIIHCIGANECVARIFDNRPASCVLNPATGREKRWGPGTLAPVSEKKKITVVGGGLGGMKVAAVAAARGHEITLLEKSGELGGHINLLKRLPSRSEWQVAIDDLGAQMARHGVQVTLDCDADAETILAAAPDCVVVATGASWTTDGLSPFRPGAAALKGLDQEHVIDIGTAVRRALEDPLSLGRSVVILDEIGTYIPLGLADLLSQQEGIRVEIITPDPMVGAEAQKTLDSFHVLPRLAAAGVILTTQQNLQGIEGHDVVTGFIWGGPPRRVSDVDTIVVAMLRRPIDEIYHALEGKIAERHLLGDALAPRKPIQVMYEAEELGRAL